MANESGSRLSLHTRPYQLYLSECSSDQCAVKIIMICYQKKTLHANQALVRLI